MFSMRRHVAFAIAVLLGVFCVGEHMPLRAQGEGIKVHGRWTIEVRNPDGTVASRHEFDNALTAGGAVYLARLLGRDGVPTRWVIQLGRYSMMGPCQGGTYNTSTPDECFIVDPQSVPLPTGTAVFPNLTTAIGGPDGTQVVLTGHATALVSGHIEYVATRLGTCLSSTLLANCNSAGGGNYFTVRDLSQPLSIAAGQIVQVRVVLSFS